MLIKWAAHPVIVFGLVSVKKKKGKIWVEDEGEEKEKKEEKGGKEEKMEKKLG